MTLTANITNFAKKVFGTQNERELKSIYPLVHKINALEPSMKKLSDAELKEMTTKFKARLAQGETLDQILPEAFAVVREAAWRVIGQRHYDVQLIGGISLHRGRIAEMRTGEGKTLVATLACYLNALAGKGVHVITVNDYLARRDSAWMGQIYGFLGLTTGIIVHGLTDKQRKENYGCDITYGTNNEFGFDYLRDNMKFRLEDYVQRELNFAIVDEVDSILIDEARTPLIISGPTDETTDLYYRIDEQIRAGGGLTKETDYTVDEKSKTAALTEAGVEKMEKRLGIDNLYDPKHIEILHHVNQALRAHVLYHRDVEYVVKDGEVMIVDDFTGRLMPGRRWSDGLHQAIEAKEGVTIENENQTLATITFQNFFRMYNKLSGMTGTADTEATEFKQIYKLDVTIIPTHRAVQRIDHSDVIYKSQLAKFKAIAEEIKVLSAKGQPVLVGTVSVEKSELLSQLLKQQGVKHNVLNAKQHEREAEIVAQAGRKSAVTIATNMAGRGTDILLGGNAEFLAKAEVGPLKKDATDEEKVAHAKALEEAQMKWKKTCDDEREIVKAAGGLFILGTERHESRRIDNQLRGRAGRQGDPGTSRFYLSFDDDLLRIFGQSTLLKQTVAAMEEDVPIEHRWTTKAIENAQRKVEGHNYDIRKHLLEYDDVMNQQRKVVYAWRREVLARGDLRDMAFSMVDELAGAIAEDFFPGGKPKRVNGSIAINEKELSEAIVTTFSLSEPIREKDITPFNGEGLRKVIHDRAEKAYQAKEAKMGSENMRNIEKMVLLTTIDGLWKDHLLAMDHLREGIGLQGYGQKDPLIAYKKEGFRFFEMMMGQITGDVVRKLFSVQMSDDASDIIEEYEEELEEEHSEAKMNFNVSADGELISNQKNPPAKSIDFEDDLLAARNAPRGAGGAQPRQIDFNAMMAERAKRQMMNQSLSAGGGPASPAAPQTINGVDLSKVGRNDTCPCGSGKKFKKCHGA
ncbi:MAG: preprotein translocase subunit SecA [Bdellovibrionales bacterium]|nr:preprotein translocase subunit SecA [Bdellovibrionales bacterium]